MSVDERRADGVSRSTPRCSTDAGALPIPSPPETNRWNQPDDPAPDRESEPAIAELPLRPWQREALAQFEASAESSFLAVATPGAGKTVFALWAALRALRRGRARRLVVVVPTQHLKRQWAQAAETVHIHIDPEWSAGYGGLPSDVHGVAITYQQVAANPAALRALVRGAMRRPVPPPGRPRSRPRCASPALPCPARERSGALFARRRQLREANSEVVRELVHDTGKSHAELNRKAGIRRVSEATIKQLEQRLELARRRLRR
jgi:hypothetical protein